MADEEVTTTPHDNIEQVDLQVEMQRSYLDYAMSVIVGRALPDVRDGLKPVHRRVIYAMYDGGYRPDKQFSKASQVRRFQGSWAKYRLRGSSKHMNRHKDSLSETEQQENPQSGRE